MSKQFEFDVGTVMMIEGDMTQEEAEKKIKKTLESLNDTSEGYCMVAEIVERRG